MRLNLILDAFYHLFGKYPTPLNLTYLWNFGVLSLFMLIIQIASGILLAMHYAPHIDYAFLSVEHIMREVPKGWFLRYTHAIGASMFFMVIYLHMARGFFYGSYQRPRGLLWVTGFNIYVLMIVTAFLGYVLPWGQMSLWGATVITSLLTIIPNVGTDILLWIWGGYSVNNPTLNRFFSLHFFLPFVIFSFVLLHLAILHLRGSNHPLGTGFKMGNVSFHPYYTIKDTYSVILFMVLYNLCLGLIPEVFLDPTNFMEANSNVTPSKIVPEWYLLSFYGILKNFSKVNGFIAMVLAIIIPLLLPLFLNSQTRVADQAFFFALNLCNLLVAFIALLIFGGMGISDLTVTIGVWFSTLYFTSLFIIIFKKKKKKKNFQTYTIPKRTFLLPMVPLPMVTIPYEIILYINIEISSEIIYSIFFNLFLENFSIREWWDWLRGKKSAVSQKNEILNDPYDSGDSGNNKNQSPKPKRTVFTPEPSFWQKFKIFLGIEKPKRRIFIPKPSFWQRLRFFLGIEEAPKPKKRTSVNSTSTSTSTSTNFFSGLFASFFNFFFPQTQGPTSSSNANANNGYSSDSDSKNQSSSADSDDDDSNRGKGKEPIKPGASPIKPGASSIKPGASSRPTSPSHGGSSSASSGSSSSSASSGPTVSKTGKPSSAIILQPQTNERPGSPLGSNANAPIDIDAPIDDFLNPEHPLSFEKSRKRKHSIVEGLKEAGLEYPLPPYESHIDTEYNDPTTELVKKYYTYVESNSKKFRTEFQQYITKNEPEACVCLKDRKQIMALFKYEFMDNKLRTKQWQLSQMPLDDKGDQAYLDLKESLAVTKLAREDALKQLDPALIRALSNFTSDRYTKKTNGKKL